MNRTDRKQGITEQAAEEVAIPTVERVTGRVPLPGSKSVTHRAFILAALSGGESVVLNALDAEDTRVTASALRDLGARVEWRGSTVRIRPPHELWRSPSSPINVGNSGTSLRLLAGLAAAGKGTFVFDGTARLRERPVGALTVALETLGAVVRFPLKRGYPPVVIESDGLCGGRVCVDASQSSQYLSSILLASTKASGPVAVSWEENVSSFPYVEITLQMMAQAGLDFRKAGPTEVVVNAPQVVKPFHYRVEGDCSSASYFWAAAALTGGSVLTYPVSQAALQGDCAFLDILSAMGCRVDWTEEGVCVQGPRTLRSVDADMNRMPDMVPTLAVLAACAEGASRIRNVAHLRIKESDRLRAVAVELSKLGVQVEEGSDGLVIQGPPRRGATIETYEDHRIAMAFAVLGLRVPGVVIRGAATVRKSFPEFWDTFFGLIHGST
ncbi:3-phosphoshikimate 1-carboxyvinyltransferase [Desulfacinum hydrothermale DSM 13146]|uniref:3-phosphoshikimate 1-carboxyvinyltransferase n=1 Tax=Desulfacinum hydrothermale DSM 13146 TaxID=1121390 RepID=A0A1W1XFR2_9BACT|nr:3-phosphoshikimate 1-carboxyvinyltransferase [Desulfacinum hydrothermale]SMC22770.1 3-phosphoshikimate 1-carboxyvinyltransferase [Desulfacinum hydrothermale DSM 13146]